MQKHLYLLCITDCLETVINKTFFDDNYFYTSLSNSFLSENTSVTYIKNTVKKHKISKVSFVLASDNQIILDALGNQFFTEKGLFNYSYNEIIKNQKIARLLTNKDAYFSVISYYLNEKIKALKNELDKALLFDIEVEAKIYDRTHHTFKNIYPDLVCIDRYCLN